MSPKVTVIVPFFRVDRDEFERCCDSIISQKVDAMEVIVVDDSGAWPADAGIKAYCARNGIRLMKNERNRGVSYSRNVAMREASGEYLAFVDADDCVYRDYLSDAVHIGDESGADCVIGKMLLTEDSVDLPERGELPTDYRTFDKEQLHLVMKGVIEGNDFTTNEVLKAGSLVPAGPCGRLYRKSSMSGATFDESLSLGEDIVFNLSVLARSERCAITDKVWYQYKQKQSSASHAIDDRGIAAYIELCHALLNNEFVQASGLEQSALGRILASFKCIMSKSITSGALSDVVKKRDMVRELLDDCAISYALDNLNESAFRLAAKDRAFIWLARRRMANSLALLFWLNNSLRNTDRP